MASLAGRGVSIRMCREEACRREQVYKQEVSSMSASGIVVWFVRHTYASREVEVEVDQHHDVVAEKIIHAMGRSSLSFTTISQDFSFHRS
jgi:hypothetical protein